MKTLNPYLFFKGNCREAMGFYKEVFGGQLELMTYEQGPEEHCRPGTEGQIMHACLTNGSLNLMASDDPISEPAVGSNIHLNLNFDTIPELESAFRKLSEDGKVIQSPTDTFWGSRFGMTIDKYGIHWMFNCPLAAKK